MLALLRDSPVRMVDHAPTDVASFTIALCRALPPASAARLVDVDRVPSLRRQAPVLPGSLVIDLREGHGDEEEQAIDEHSPPHQGVRRRGSLGLARLSGWEARHDVTCLISSHQ